ncbi:hypothetical protein F7725_026146 [Dissostichus mawsoni]|uniref:Uncharacterized protein n=1 Tax=Dissostichus mawsoni TaxID=36200 RepID=A0A7J5X685_DISMA|nr:hypothetical protein F7725_026146 [Dissostichus mawsoni]
MQECEADVSKETNKVIQKEKEMANLREGMAAEIKTEKDKSRILDQNFRIAETETGRPGQG